MSIIDLNERGTLQRLRSADKVLVRISSNWVVRRFWQNTKTSLCGSPSRRSMFANKKLFSSFKAYEERLFLFSLPLKMTAFFVYLIRSWCFLAWVGRGAGSSGGRYGKVRRDLDFNDPASLTVSGVIANPEMWSLSHSKSQEIPLRGSGLRIPIYRL